MSAATFASVPWAPVTDATTGKTVGWHKHDVPYITGGTYLQTLDLWVPATEPKDGNPDPPSSDGVPALSKPWVVYVHGGAWRDPLVDSSSFANTAKFLLSKAAASKPQFAGLASINYRLSSHPHHPTRPSPPADPAQPVDVARTAKHPDHIGDVLEALAYLQKGLGIAQDYLLSGHSCGATLAFQVVMNRARLGDITAPPVAKPRCILGLNGLYDLVQFLRAPDASHQSLAQLYETFTRNAFGDDEATWEAVCPGAVKDWAEEWPEPHKIVLVQSKEDTLVPYSQLEAMSKKLTATGKAPVRELDASGDHNWLWQSGERLSSIVETVLSEWS